MILPLLSMGMEMGFMEACRRSLERQYYEPKARFIQALASHAGGRSNEAPPPPPILGDIEMVYGANIAISALLIDNIKFVSTLVEVMFNRGSRSWMTGLIFCVVSDVLKRTGVIAHVLHRLLAKCGKQKWAMMDAIELNYLRSQRHVGYVAASTGISVGCLRAITFGDARAILWLDVDPIICVVFLSNIGAQLLTDLIVRLVDRANVIAHPMKVGYPSDHPVINAVRRDLSMRGYAYVFLPGCMVIYMALLAFLGPEFVLGLCETFNEERLGIAFVTALDQRCSMRNLTRLNVTGNLTLYLTGNRTGNLTM